MPIQEGNGYFWSTFCNFLPVNSRTLEVRFLQDLLLRQVSVFSVTRPEPPKSLSCNWPHKGVLASALVCSSVSPENGPGVLGKDSLKQKWS